MKKIATYVKDLDSYHGVAELYQLAPPHKGVEYVVVSALRDYAAHETYIFPANEDGHVIDWGELPGSYRGGTDMEKALNGLGYSSKITDWMESLE